MASSKIKNVINRSTGVSRSPQIAKNTKAHTARQRGLRKSMGLSAG
jgi:hypothetical protein